MKKLYFLLFTLLFTVVSFGQTVFINEIHYDNASSDVNEAIEIAGPAGTDLTGWTIEKYNGSDSSSYGTENLSGTIPDQQAGYGTLNFILVANALQNGSPDAIALVDDMGTVIQFLSYEGVITAVDGPAMGMTSTDIGVAETSSTPVGHSLQLGGSGDTYEEFSWQIAMANTYGTVNTNQTFTAVNSPSLTITAPTDMAVFDPGTTSVTLSINVQNFDVQPGGAGDGYIVWSIDNGGGDVPQPDKFDTADESIPVMDGGSYFVIMDLVDNGGTPIGVSATVGFDVSAATQVADLAALRADVAMNGTGGFYELMSTPTVTYTRTSRNQKYIQDASAGILIDDSAGTIVTSFSIGDGITGLVGQASEFNGVLQFVPSVDASVVAGTTVVPEVVTISTLLTNWEDYESELVRINGASFADGGMTFSSSTNYDINDGSIMTFRTSFSEADYIGEIIPTGPTNMSVLVAEFNGTPQVTARSLSELTLSTNDINNVDSILEIYPNPTSTGLVTISGVNNAPYQVSVYNVLGKQVLNTEVTSTLDVSGLKAGVYILNIAQEGVTTTKKLVIK